jgi:hypothetical protein
LGSNFRLVRLDLGSVTRDTGVLFRAPRPQILCRGMREGLERKVLPLKTSHATGYGRCEQLFTLFFGFSIKTTQTNPTVDPSGNPDAHTCHSTSHLHPPPGPWPRGCAPPTPTCSYTSIHSMPITPEKLQPKTCGRSTLLAATGPRNMHGGGGCDYGCGLGIDTDASDAVGGWWVRPEAPAGRSEGRREGRRGSQIMTHYNEAECRRVRGPRAAEHLRRRPDRRPVGYGGGGARPPTQ